MSFCRKTIRKSRGYKQCQLCSGDIDHGDYYYNIAMKLYEGFEYRYSHLFCEDLSISYMDDNEDELPYYEDCLYEWLKKHLSENEASECYKESKRWRFKK